LKIRSYKILLKLLLKAKKRKKIEFGSVCLIHKRCVCIISVLEFFLL